MSSKPIAAVVKVCASCGADHRDDSTKCWLCGGERFSTLDSEGVSEEVHLELVRPQSAESSYPFATTLLVLAIIAVFAGMLITHPSLEWPVFLIPPLVLFLLIAVLPIRVNKLRLVSLTAGKIVVFSLISVLAMTVVAFAAFVDFVAICLSRMASVS